MQQQKENAGFRRRGYTRLMNWYREHDIYLPLLNETARTAMRLKLARDRSAVNRKCAGKASEIDDWYGGLRLFFGFSSIRCGTVFLSNMLKIEVPRSHIEHEANLDDYWHMRQVYQDREAAVDYVRDFRRNEIYCRAEHDIDIYGEINPMLRAHAHAFATVFPEAKLFHMIRDPRGVIRSIMGKENLGKKDPMSKVLFPPPDDPYHEQWDSMSRFEKVCWAWQFDNRHLRSHLDHRLQFEPMMSDYDYFRERLVDYLGIELSQETWSGYVDRPRNASKKYRFPHYTEWDKSLLETLDRICGEEMAHYGYSV